MKKCNTELMKELKAVQCEIEELNNNAFIKRHINYYEGEEEPCREFDYDKYINEFERLQATEWKIKGLLARSNATTKLYGMEELTIGDGLIKLAQLNNRLKTLSSFKTTTQVIKNLEHAKFEGDKDRVYVNENLYSPEKVDKDIKNLQSEISRLQVAIDRTNLTNLIDC